MKLNNHGWGTGEFIFSIVAILVLLLIISFNVHNLYSSFDDDDNTNSNTNSQVIDNQTNNNSEDVNNNSGDSDTSVETEEEYREEYYVEYQNKMINATRNYIIYSTPAIPESGLKVDLLTLVNKNYINSLNDMVDGSICNGYSMVFLNSDSSLNIMTYLNCSNYVTEGYIGG